MSQELAKIYDAKFYGQQISGMKCSAATVLQYLFEFYRPQSILDAGCGQGAWLEEAARLGVSRLVGMDGAWVSDVLTNHQKIEFRQVDFSLEIPTITERFDLCISLEVAEHLPINMAPQFITFLSNSANIVAFGAAIKGQGGENHINEQPQSFWVDLFAVNGFECFDVFRPLLWHNADVEWWYRQNMFLFIRKGSHGIDTEQLLRRCTPILDIVHPENFQEKLEYFQTKLHRPSLQYLWKHFRRYLHRQLMFKK